jgi:hypothetical protein
MASGPRHMFAEPRAAEEEEEGRRVVVGVAYRHSNLASLCRCSIPSPSLSPSL